MSDMSPPVAAAQNEVKAIRTLQNLCYAAVSASAGEAEICLGTRIFGTDSFKLDFDDYAIAIVRAKLDLQGYSTDIAIKMDSKCRKVILQIWTPTPYATKTVAAKLQERR